MPLNAPPALAALPVLGASDSGPTKPATPAPGTSGPDWLTGEVAQITTILLGLILIVAGLFQFKQVQTVVEHAAIAA